MITNTYCVKNHILMTLMQKEHVAIIMNTLDIASPEWTPEELAECIRANAFHVELIEIDAKFD